MQLTTERHVSTLQGYHQAYKIIVLTKVHTVLLPRDPVSSITVCTLINTIIL